MIPLTSRLSVYAAGAGGGGSFHRPQIVPDAGPSVISTVTWHGVFDFGGGVDLRLSRPFSIRGEVRDFVTGAGLGGSPGRNHLIAAGGLALHF